MNRTILKNILQNQYDRDQWISTLQFLNGKRDLLAINMSTKIIEIKSQEDENLIKSFYQIGSIKTSDGIVLPIFEIILQDHIRIEYDRVSVNEFIKKHIIKDFIKGALTTFSYDTNHQKKEWRFSLISKNSANNFLVESEKTNPKKYTYIFGNIEEHRTAIEQFYNLEKSLFRLEDFFEAFNVELVSQKFFEEYKHLYREFYSFIISNDNYLSLLMNLNDNSLKNEKETRNFVSRLLGRIVFLYFLQKKNWLGASSTEYKDGSTTFLSDLFYNDVENQDDFYNKYLCPIFFDALNAADRRNDEIKLENGKIVCIPFLSGFFDEEKEPKGHRKIKIPAFQFKMLFDFFNGFNFTLYENSSEEHTVAVDPEMLGYIFENLIDYNKDTGTFYTPKEIVHFMTQESIIEYLNTHLKKERIYIEDMVKNQNANHFEDDELSKINQLLDDIRICDPAIGSGTFSLGILQEIFNLKALINFKLGLDVWSPVIVKQNIIQNSIYGVDLDEGAVEIARLRLWLSLVVDEVLPKVLPNLDYKIVVGNSLVNQIEGQLIEIDWSLENTVGELSLQEKIESLKTISYKQQKYFNATAENKKKLKKEIADLKLIILSNELQIMINSKGTKFRSLTKNTKKQNEIFEQTLIWKKALETVNTLKENKQLTFTNFDWSLDFPEILNPLLNKKENLGFDIVIGNPPYIQLQKEGGRLAKLFENASFQTFERTGDIYALFFEKGINMLKSKGLLCYITSNKWMRTNYGSSLRQFFVERTHPLLVLDFGNIQVFRTATVETNILLLKNKDELNKKAYVPAVGARLNKDFVLYQNSLSEFVKFEGYKLSGLSKNSWVIGERDIYNIKEFVEKQGIALKNWKVEIYRGIVTGFNKAFVIDEDIKNQLVTEDPRNNEIIKPILSGKDIDVWYPKLGKQWLINSHNGLKDKGVDRINVKKDYPSIYKWLSKYKIELEDRKEKGDEWTNLRNCNYIDHFKLPKIMYRDITQSFDFSYVEDEFYGNNTVSIISGENLKYLNCFFNSSIFKYCFKDNFSNLGSNATRLFTSSFKEILIKKPDINTDNIFKLIVEVLVELKKHELKDSNDQFMMVFFEQIADALIFELYFKEDFKNEGLSIAIHLLDEKINLDKQLDLKERLIQIRKLYLKLYQEHHPVRQAISQMLSIPQVNLVKNSLIQ